MTKRKIKQGLSRTRRTEPQIVGFRCMDCNDVVLFSRQKEFKTCKCGRSSGDAGDGLYYRLMGMADGLLTVVPRRKRKK